MIQGYKKVEVDFSVFQYFNVRIFCSVNLISAVYLQNLLNESFASFKTPNLYCKKAKTSAFQ